MTAVGTCGTYKAPTDMQAAPKEVLARVGPGTLSAALVTWISEDTKTVNLRVFPDQQESFVIRGVEFGDNPILGNFNDPEFIDPASTSRKANVGQGVTPPKSNPNPLLKKKED